MMSLRLLPFPFCLLLPLLGAIAAPAAAQCSYSWPAAAFGSGCDDTVSAVVALPDGPVVGGRFLLAGGGSATRIARWTGAAWSALGTGVDGDVLELVRLPDGDIVAGGVFLNAGGAPATHVARWNGSTWGALGAGITPTMPFGSSVQALVVLPNGDLVAGGAFQQAGGVTVNNVARWDGVAWHALGSGTNGTVRDLAVLPNGDLVATGSFLAAGGTAASGIARWNGSSWSALGSGLGIFGGTAVCVLPNGDLVAGGSFVTAGGLAANRVARWSGGAWSALGTGLGGPPSRLLALPAGDVIAVGAFTSAGGGPAAYIARWNGAAWSAFGTGLNAVAEDAALQPDGSLVVVGQFTTADGNAAARVARLQSSCAPTATTVGSGCVGAGGLNTLVASELPLVGGTFRATATGMPPLGIVLALTGFTTFAVPLSLLLPEALPGCTLYNGLDLYDFLLPVGGVATIALAVPGDPGLVGFPFWHQHLPFELDVNLAITAVTATNAVQLTIGTF